ncbi:hypothetical protein M0R45_000191 [Rubus argutus]|uniref:MHC class I antigen n=1 Tax=Rubus argutus TaxID=59490 RepID=A0AAW1VLE6_RUBAR
MGDHERELRTGCGKEATAATAIEITPVGLTAKGAASGRRLGSWLVAGDSNWAGLIDRRQRTWEQQRRRIEGDGDRRSGRTSRAGQKEIEQGLDGGDASE